MKLISWNVNGIRAVLRKNLFLPFVADHDPDVICLQETKAHPQQVELDLPSHPYQYWHSAEKKGYSGTAIFSKREPLSVSYGIGMESCDSEGRLVAAEFDDYYAVSVYVPNSKRDLSRLDERQDWDRAFLAHLKDLEKHKPVVFSGDFNVAHTEIDLARPKENEGPSRLYQGGARRLRRLRGRGASSTRFAACTPTRGTTTPGGGKWAARANATSAGASTTS